MKLISFLKPIMVAASLVAIASTANAQGTWSGTTTTDNVGIGTTSPTEQLHINGNMLLEGSIEGGSTVNGLRIASNTNETNGGALTLYDQGAVNYGGMVRVRTTLQTPGSAAWREGEFRVQQYVASSGTVNHQFTVNNNGMLGAGTEYCAASLHLRNPHQENLTILMDGTGMRFSEAPDNPQYQTGRKWSLTTDLSGRFYVRVGPSVAAGGSTLNPLRMEVIEHPLTGVLMPLTRSKGLTHMMSTVSTADVGFADGYGAMGEDPTHLRLDVNGALRATNAAGTPGNMKYVSVSHNGGNGYVQSSGGRLVLDASSELVHALNNFKVGPGFDLTAGYSTGSALGPLRFGVTGAGRFIDDTDNSNYVAIGAMFGGSGHIESSNTLVINRESQARVTIGDYVTPKSDGEQFRVYGDSRFHGDVMACKVFTEEVTVESGWCDYVFEEDYPLMPIEELGKFIKTNHHLPNIPSAAEVETNGLHMADMQRRMMEKIEELSLYVIQLQQEIDVLQSADGSK